FAGRRWAVGSYGLPMPATGCPTGVGFTWETGFRFQDTENRGSNNERSPNIYNDIHLMAHQRNDMAPFQYNHNTGQYNHDTVIHYCCMTTEDIYKPINLPADRPFYLFAFTDQCQPVQGMEDTLEWFKRDNEDGSNSRNNLVGHHPYYETASGINNHKHYYCYRDH
ncbi:uncharacterized protein LOC110981648, partial [Acanthaster planci]|uniref:Uncharacterized protein LOC110981648 n=1 Tax=Acanthaster planci TaxID=133434 RepID=A0A8B7YP73_ACAPL